MRRGVVGEEECGIARVRWHSLAWDVQLIEDGPGDGLIIDHRDDAEGAVGEKIGGPLLGQGNHLFECRAVRCFANAWLEIDRV